MTGDRFYAVYHSPNGGWAKMVYRGFVRTADGRLVYRVEKECDAVELARRLNEAYELGQQEAMKLWKP